ncbi:branched-chain amino acid transport system II carrier protein [Limosilactobacillus reuteri]|uniref:branched-chain amino acid transport system II carrier protein n=1 Tax=Limosilactobacillus reuteri TaxID=1598 RepID=UPI001E4EAB70|nr:branched-chain amino acid transport system II carrier protein [Limosilactobacillus reuteri]MCC4343468.1 branched-chain amino acid transport system II carrier protein [Limosilactobacillus reuteri]
MSSIKAACKTYLVIGSLIFGMLFGAGNLIFPVHLGQLAGNQWIAATGGFLLSGVLLPLFALLAISITHANGLYELALPNGKRFALIFLVLVQIIIGPLCATPRTATVPYTIGVAPYLSKGMQGWGLLAYTGAFFLIVYFFATREGKINEIIGKVLNPIFLIMLFLIFLLAFIHPMGSTSTPQPTLEYVNHAFSNGFIQGYNTVDALAALVFGVTIITAIRQLGFKSQQSVSLATTKGGMIGIFGIGILYIGLIYLGTTSRHQFAIAANGGTTLNQIAHYYMGDFGNVLLLTLATITCMTTAMGLVVAFAQDFHYRFPQISYKAFLRGNCLLSFLVANMGLDRIVSWSIPVLMFLYPLAIVLILLGIFSPLFKGASLIYRVTTGITMIPAFFDMINAFPPVLRDTAFSMSLIHFAEKYFPLYQLGFSWLPFTLVGLFISICIWYPQQRSRV